MLRAAMVATVAMSSIGVASVAHAQSQTPYGPDNGFFRPAPDVSLTAPTSAQAGGTAQANVQPYVTLQQSVAGTPLPAPMRSAANPVTVPVTPVVPPPVAPAAAAPVTPMVAPPVTPMVAPQAATPVTAAPAATAAAPQQAAQAAAEQQMDRSLAESERERARMMTTPAGVGAEFDGTTSDANR